jgi:hypothetical protein
MASTGIYLFLRLEKWIYFHIQVEEGRGILRDWVCLKETLSKIRLLVENKYYTYSLRLYFSVLFSTWKQKQHHISKRWPTEKEVQIVDIIQDTGQS